MKNICCFCKLPVLGIPGQDTLLDSYNLKNELQDQRAIAEGVFGDCHLLCLQDSKWSEFWFERRLENFIDVRGYQFLLKKGGAVLLRNPQNTKYVMGAMSGPLLLVDVRDISNGFRPEESLIRLVDPERNWKIPESSPAAEGIVEDFLKSGEMSLLTLAEAFNCRDKLFDEVAARQGKLNCIPDKSAQFFATGYLVASLTSIVRLQKEVVDILKMQSS
jgi:hypothetical protein